MISASVEAGSVGRALGLHMIGGSASFFLAPLIAAGIAAHWGWRISFIGLALPTFFFGVIFYRAVGKKIVVKKRESSLTKGSVQAPTSCASGLRQLFPFMVLVTVNHAIIFSVVSFIPLFLVDYFRITEEHAAGFIALIYSAGLWAGPLGGYLSDRWGSLTVILLISFVSGPAIHLLDVVPYPLGIGGILLVIGMIMYIRMPVSEAFLVSKSPEGKSSTVLGIYFLVSMEGGGILTPMMGYFVDHLGFKLAFNMAGAALVIVTFICSLWLWKTN
jgi:predicted MFS family arabinose efflux permease